jgi:hypothetical protein
MFNPAPDLSDPYSKDSWNTRFMHSHSGSRIIRKSFYDLDSRPFEHLERPQRGPHRVGRLLAWLATLLLPGLTSLGCLAWSPGPSIEPNPSEQADSRTPVRHWPLDPGTLETVLRSEPIEIVSESYAGAGLTGASRLEIRLLGHRETISAKWKPMPTRLDGINNSPRKEIAAYEVQKFVLEPEDYVVPTSVARCLPPSAFPDPSRHSEATLPGSRCELGVLTVWLENVTLPDPLLDLERFRQDGVYARHLGHFNLVTYLIHHQDGRRGNFLVSTDDRDRRVFSIDNGVAFSGILYNWFVRNWKRIRVPALPQRAIERLEQIRPEDLEPLAVVTELRLGPDGIFVPVPAGPIRERDEGVRIDGPTIQLGLDEDEIEDLWERIEDLLEEIRDGDLGVLPPTSTSASPAERS